VVESNSQISVRNFQYHFEYHGHESGVLHAQLFYPYQLYVGTLQWQTYTGDMILVAESCRNALNHSFSTCTMLTGEAACTHCGVFSYYNEHA
jgi:hypothetical protein